jgi:hypothetical protein
MNRPLLTSPDLTQEKCQSSRSDFSSSPPPKGGEVGEVNEDRTTTVQPQNNEVRWERSMTSTLADHTTTDHPRRAVSEYDYGDFPRGDPEAYFVEADEIEAGAFLRGLFGSLPPWRRQALCGDHDLGIFYPAKGGSNKPGLAVCAACPVRHPCLAEALDDSSLDWGIRGGMTALARVAARKAQVADDTERAA